MDTENKVTKYHFECPDGTECRIEISGPRGNKGVLGAILNFSLVLDELFPSDEPRGCIPNEMRSWKEQ